MKVDELEISCVTLRRPLLAYLFALCGDYHQAEDLVQETMLIASQKREHYFPEADFGAWLRAIARNVWKRELAKRGKRPGNVELADDLVDYLFSSDHYEEERWEEEKAALARCMSRLPEKDRGIIRGHFNEGKSYAEIAASGGRTLSWVKVRMFRARKALFDCVQRSLRTMKRERGSV